MWTGTEMIVWGGSSYEGGGARYSRPVDATVRRRIPGLRFRPTGAPFPREDMTAVWTGTEMIVWGGIFFVNPQYAYTNTGGRYAPSTNSWAPTSTGSNVPAPRDGFTAVWTGVDMVVWGGFIYAQSFTNTGSLYEPILDTWIPMSTGTGDPSPRSQHTAVWTASEMIVWGGGTDTTNFNTGGRYCDAPCTDDISCGDGNACTNDTC